MREIEGMELALESIAKGIRDILAIAIGYKLSVLVGSDPWAWGFTHCPCMIYYTLVGVRADRTRTGGDTPARALLS